MNIKTNSSFDSVIAGGGIAGLVTALELIEHGQNVCIIDRDTPQNLGGLAKLAFGGMAFSGTKQQKRMRVKDSPEQILKDWQSFADFHEDDYWPKAWAREYAEKNVSEVYLWLQKRGLKFMPAVNWVERGLFVPGNSVPRYHILWGTGWELVKVVVNLLTPYQKNKRLTILHQHKVLSPIVSDGKVTAIEIEDEINKTTFLINTPNVVIACGGINGSTQRVNKNWRLPPKGELAQAPLNGANPITDGKLHDKIEKLGGQITHVDKMWNYAAGVKHPQAEFDNHGLSLIPCKSGLWVNYKGKRIGPVPLVTGFDTNYMCQQVAKQEQPWTWQILNKEIAIKELAVSGSLHNPTFKNKKIFNFVKELFFGNPRLVNELINDSEDFICADSVAELVNKMNLHTKEKHIDLATLENELNLFDKQLSLPTKLQNDDQIRRIQHARQWKVDRLRTCKPKPIMQSNNLIAIKLQLISRKSLGGIQTNLKSEVLDNQGKRITGLYSVGEAAGFGGGGSNGARSLEGTFLSTCILTARNAANAIIARKNNHHTEKQK